MTHPSALPAPAGWTEAIWRAAQAQAISWPEAQYLQDMALPRCLKHNEPIKITDGGGLCVRCVEELAGEPRG
jgi:hypothetical protein